MENASERMSDAEALAELRHDLAGAKSGNPAFGPPPWMTMAEHIAYLESEIARMERAEAEKAFTVIGFRVSAMTFPGRVKSVVFSTLAAAETFARKNAHCNPTIEAVPISSRTGQLLNGKVK